MNAIKLKEDTIKKLLVLDLDGTLLTESKHITDKTRYSLQKAQDKEIEICIATGRVFESAKFFPLNYKIKAHMICANGAMIKDPYSLKEHYRATVDPKEAQDVSQYAMEIDALLHIFTGSDWYISKLADSAMNFGRMNNLTHKMIQDIENWDKLDIIKMVLVDTAKKIDMLEKWTKNKKFNINVVRSDPNSIDLTHKNASKGNAVRWIAHSLGIDKTNIIAVGNYYNDIDMLKEANIGVAMDNSPEEVKKVADFITKSNEEDGVACVIDKFILNDYSKCQNFGGKCMERLDKLSTESINVNTLNLDSLEIDEIVRKINEEDKKVAMAVEEVIPQISEAVKEMKKRWDKGGRLIYIGAGTSGRLGVIDAAENPSTFGTDPARVIGILAGGDIGMRQPVEGIEDSFEQGYNDIAAVNLSENDSVIGIAASGRTPYVFGAFKKCDEVGALKIGVACNKEAKLKEVVDIAILPEPGPEVIMGSTRMKAGTAQKMVLNMLSTALMVTSGKVYKNLMVDMQQVNEKLRNRTERMVSIACDVNIEEARNLLSQAGGNVKIAILLNAGLTKEEAVRGLAMYNGHVRKVLESRK